MKQHLAPRWRARCYKKAGEAVVYRQTDGGHDTGKRGEAKDPERASREADRRRKTKVRRLCVENRLSRLWTFTYAVEPTDRDTVVHDVDTFLKRLRRRYPRLKFLWTIERGEKNGRLHVHMGANAYIPKPVLAAIWSHGFVDCRRLRGRDDGSGDASSVARYLAKYVAKSGGQSDPLLWNRRRYGRSGNLTLTATDFEAHDEVEAERIVLLAMGAGPPKYVWRSSETEDWRGPPVSVAFFKVT